MPVQTRSAAKREKEAPRQPLKLENNAIKITNPASGEKKEIISWYREPSGHREVINPDLDADPRFKTPAPQNARPATPPKIERRSRQSTVMPPSGNSIRIDLVEKLAQVSAKSLLEQAQWRCGEEDASLASENSVRDDPGLGSPLFNDPPSRWMQNFAQGQSLHASSLDCHVTGLQGNRASKGLSRGSSTSDFTA